MRLLSLLREQGEEGAGLSAAANVELDVKAMLTKGKKQEGGKSARDSLM
jgi:hypothetical protein